MCGVLQEVATQLDHHFQSAPVASSDTICVIAKNTVQQSWSLGGCSELNLSSATLVQEKRLAVQNHEKVNDVMFSWNT